jgi:hypothetical protein
MLSILPRFVDRMSCRFFAGWRNIRDAAAAADVASHHDLSPLLSAEVRFQGAPTTG